MAHINKGKIVTLDNETLRKMKKDNCPFWDLKEYIGQVLLVWAESQHPANIMIFFDFFIRIDSALIVF